MIVNPVHHTVMIETILKDPVSLSAILILFGGIVLLLWAFKKWFEQETTEQTPSLEEPQTSVPADAARPPESAELVQQLIERLNQLTERIYLIEKKETEVPATETTHKLEMIMNRLMALELVVQKNTAQSGLAPYDKEISMAFKGLTDRIGILEKAVQILQSRERLPRSSGK